MPFDILTTENPRIPIAKIEISIPLNGKNVKTAVPNPRADRIPIPHAAHPGARIPRKIPVVSKKPIPFEDFLIIIVLYVIKLNSTPSKTLIVTRLAKELSKIVSLNPTNKTRKNFIPKIKPLPK